MFDFKTVLAGLALNLALAAPSWAVEPAGAEGARSVIQSQLDAFKSKSAEDAYEFAAPNVQRIFPTPDVFGKMVKRGYPMVWNPGDTQFLDAKELGDSLVQRLRIIDQGGRAFIAEYMMVQVEGQWRIAGVSITRDTATAGA